MKRAHLRTRLLASVLLAAAFAVAFSPLSPPAGTAGPSPSHLSTAHSYLDPFASLHRGFFSPAAAEAAPLPTNSAGSVYYRETAHYLKDAFLNYWLMNGGLTIYGYPVSEEYTDPNGVPMQYFERARFEYHTESNRPWKVELSPLGRMVTDGQVFAPVPPPDPSRGLAYFQETQHTLGGAFLRFWQANGGLVIFGYPISEELDADGTTVQYFERARFELAAQGRVQLGHVGTEVMQQQMALGLLDPSIPAPQDRPGFNMDYRGEATWFHADWARVIRLNKEWGNLPHDYVGRGLYAAAPADLNLYGRWARVTRGNRSIYVQFIDCINWPDIPYVRSRGIVIDLGEESFRALGAYNGGHYEVSFQVFWPGEGPDAR